MTADLYTLPVITTPAPILTDTPARWADAYRLWLTSRRSPSTRRAYRKACELLIDFAGKAPWEIGKADVAAWIASQQAAGLAPETIHQRLAAVSSFYTWVTRVYTLPDPAGREIPLHAYNPVTAIPRPRVTPYGKSIYLSPEQARAFLRAIPLTTLQGLRDYALCLTYLLTGRRNTEIRTLRWGDIENAGAGLHYSWSGKGKSRRDEFPLPAYQAILAYLSAAGRLSTIQPNDPIFTALKDTASRLPGRLPTSDPRLPTPLSARMVGRLIKKYARRAGLDPTRITVHTLRHTAAMLRKAAGDSLENISALLGHSNIAITQIYLHRIEGQPDAAWQKVEALLALPQLPGVPTPPASTDPARPRIRRRLRPSVR